MASKFGWVDFADDDRQKMLDVIQLFRERDTRDELGIGTIRDAFSDHFFPGTSTIQTRVRYMLFIPWLYIDLERRTIPSSKIWERARAREIQLIFSLLNGGETEGVIGSEAKKGLQRLPSNIYWTGLGSWGIRLFQGSQDQYYRTLDNYYLKLRTTHGKETDDEFYNSCSTPNWHPGIPDSPKDLMESASLNLTNKEANYLLDRILNLHPKSLLAAFLRKKKISKTSFFWEQSTVDTLPQGLKEDIRQARNFSEVIHGASLLYNLMLAQTIENDEWIEKYENQIDKWAENLSSRMMELENWYKQIDDFWNSAALSLANMPLPTRRFVNQWFHFVFISPGPDKVGGSEKVRFEITKRETALKKNRARLQNRRSLELWEGESGTRQLSYRWANASIFILDILKGLKEKSNVA